MAVGGDLTTEEVIGQMVTGVQVREDTRMGGGEPRDAGASLGWPLGCDRGSVRVHSRHTGVCVAGFG